MAADSSFAVPGPHSREHFLDAQRRHRRASWRATAIALPAVMAAGIPLCVLVTPVIATPFILAGLVLNSVGALPSGVYEGLYEAVHVMPSAWFALWGEDTVSLRLLLAMLVLPGAVLMLFSWLAIRFLLRHAWVGSALARLGARPADPLRLEERQLMNIVEELAVAAAVPAPRVALIDSPQANAVAIGLSIDDSTIAVSTGLLQTLDRAETQAYIAHLVGSIGNGDLRIAATFLSVFQAWGMMALTVDALFSSEARAALRHIARTFRQTVGGRVGEEDQRQAVDFLLDGAGQSHENLERYLDGIEYGRMDGREVVRNLLIDLPLLLTGAILSITTRAAIGIFSVLVFGPPIAALWRSRRRLADAAAVELTRQPDALASAIDRLASAKVEVPGGEPLSFLFPFWTPGADLRPDRADVVGQIPRLEVEPHRRITELRRLGATIATSIPKPKADTPKEIARDIMLLLLLIGGTAVGLALLAGVSLFFMGVLLVLLWKLLELVLVSLPAVALNALS